MSACGWLAVSRSCVVLCYFDTVICGVYVFTISIVALQVAEHGVHDLGTARHHTPGQ